MTTTAPGTRGALPAGVRTTVQVPLTFADGYTTTADVYTFTGLVDGKEHLALGLGDYRRSGTARPDTPTSSTPSSSTSGTSASSAGTAGDGTRGIGTAGAGVAGTGVAGSGARRLDVPLVRMHSECLTGDVFGSARCDCGPQLREAVERIATTGGYLLYLRQEGRGIGLYAKLDAYALQDTGLDTYEANRALGHADDERDYTPAAQMLAALGIDQIDLLTNNPDKPAQLRALGVDVRDVVPTAVHASPHNLRYLTAKVAHTAHTLDLCPVA